MHSLGIALAAGACAALIGAGLARGQDFESVEIQVVPVAERLHMLVGAGGNIGVSTGDDGVFLIDDQYAPLTDKIRAAVATLSDRPIRFVLNTHFHGDHTGGNENLGKAGAAIVAHRNVRERMSVDQFRAIQNRTIPAAPPAALPIVTFTRDVTFHVNGHDVHVLHVPAAHTDGDAIVHFRGVDAIHVGDTYFNGMYPFIDVGSGGSIDGMVAAVDVALAAIGDATAVIPGHGPLSDRAGLRAYRDMLAAVRDRVKELVDAGKSADEVVAAKPTAEFDAANAGGFLTPEQFTRIVYASLRAP